MLSVSGRGRSFPLNQLNGPGERPVMERSRLKKYALVKWRRFGYHA